MVTIKYNLTRIQDIFECSTNQKNNIKYLELLVTEGIKLKQEKNNSYIIILSPSNWRICFGY